MEQIKDKTDNNWNQTIPCKMPQSRHTIQTHIPIEAECKSSHYKTIRNTITIQITEWHRKQHEENQHMIPDTYTSWFCCDSYTTRWNSPCQPLFCKYWNIFFDKGNTVKRNRVKIEKLSFQISPFYDILKEEIHWK